MDNPLGQYAHDDLSGTGARNVLPAAATNTESRVIRAANRNGRPPIGAANRPTSIAEVASHVQEYENQLKRKAVPLTAIRLLDGRMNAAGDELTIDVAGYERLSKAVGAPLAYLDRIGSELKCRNLEYGLNRIGRRAAGLSDGNSEVLFRDGIFVGFKRLDLLILAGTEVLDALRDGLGNLADGLRVQNFKMRSERFSLDVVSDQLFREVRVGDIVQAGVHVEHSMLGEHATFIWAFIFRLACRNGLLHRECVGSRMTGRTRRLDPRRQASRTHQLNQIRSLVVDTVSKLEQKLEAIEKLQATRFANAHEIYGTFEQFLRRARMYSDNLMRLLRQVWSEQRGGNGEMTNFGVLNAMTWLASHASELNGAEYRPTERQQHALARLAGVFANQNVHLCPHCFGTGFMSAEASDHPDHAHVGLAAV